MMKVLIVDENIHDREMIAAFLERRFPKEVQYKMADNGRRAVDMAALWGADILLMDTQLPGMSGIDVAKRIRSQTQTCQVVFITAAKSFEYAYEALKLGSCDYVLKPIRPEELETALVGAMHRLEEQRRLKATALLPNVPDPDIIPDKHALLMEKVRSYLHHNYMMCNISLDSVSAILNVNSSYFSSQFKRFFGVNFVDYLTNLRIQEAKRLLRDPLRPASEIAGMVGYETANYFARAFKKKTGMTPTQYRRTIAETDRSM